MDQVMDTQTISSTSELDGNPESDQILNVTATATSSDVEGVDEADQIFATVSNTTNSSVAGNAGVIQTIVITSISTTSGESGIGTDAIVMVIVAISTTSGDTAIEPTDARVMTVVSVSTTSSVAGISKPYQQFTIIPILSNSGEAGSPSDAIVMSVASISTISGVDYTYVMTQGSIFAQSTLGWRTFITPFNIISTGSRVLYVYVMTTTSPLTTSGLTGIPSQKFTLSVVPIGTTSNTNGVASAVQILAHVSDLSNSAVAGVPSLIQTLHTTTILTYGFTSLAPCAISIISTSSASIQETALLTSTCTSTSNSTATIKDRIGATVASTGNSTASLVVIQTIEIDSVAIGSSSAALLLPLDLSPQIALQTGTASVSIPYTPLIQNVKATGSSSVNVYVTSPQRTVLIEGFYTDMSGAALPNTLINIQLNTSNTTVSNLNIDYSPTPYFTDNTGAFAFSLVAPQDIPNGVYTYTIVFDPNGPDPTIFNTTSFAYASGTKGLDYIIDTANSTVSLVRGQYYNFRGIPVAGVLIKANISVQATDPFNNNVISPFSTFSTRTYVDGTYCLYLPPNYRLTPANTYYTITEGSADARQIYITQNGSYITNNIVIKDYVQNTMGMSYSNVMNDPNQSSTLDSLTTASSAQNTMSRIRNVIVEPTGFADWPSLVASSAAFLQLNSTRTPSGAVQLASAVTTAELESIAIAGTTSQDITKIVVTGGIPITVNGGFWTDQYGTISFTVGGTNGTYSGDLLTYTFITSLTNNINASIILSPDDAITAKAFPSMDIYAKINTTQFIVGIINPIVITGSIGLPQYTFSYFIEGV